METISNEQKAREIGKDWYNAKCYGVPMDSDEVAEQVALEMAQWKDKQFEEERREFLNKAYDSLKPLLDPDSLMVVQHKLLELVYPVEFIE